MKLASDLIDVRERQPVSMRAIGQQDEDAFTMRIDPATRAGEPGVTERIRRQRPARG